MSIRTFILLSSLLVSSFVHSIEIDPNPNQELSKSHFLHLMHAKVSEAIENAQDFPGLQTEEVFDLKIDLLKTWDSLIKEGELKVTGTDSEIRPIFVTLQGFVEQVLASELQQNVKNLKGFIHTPLPATPLCTKGEISPELIDPSLANDPKRLFTVKMRPTIIRDYLFKGATLYIAYPKNGLSQRTEEQQKIYKQEIANYPERLRDMPLNCESLPQELIGATYFFENLNGEIFVFSIQMTQAKDPKEIGNFGLWFGPTDLPSIQERVFNILTYITDNIDIYY